MHQNRKADGNKTGFSEHRQSSQDKAKLPRRHPEQNLSYTNENVALIPPGNKEKPTRRLSTRDPLDLGPSNARSSLIKKYINPDRKIAAGANPSTLVTKVRVYEGLFDPSTLATDVRGGRVMLSDVDDAGNTPLHVAAENGWSDEQLDAFVDGPRCLHSENESHMTPLHLLCASSNVRAISKLHSKYSFDVNTKSSLDISLLHAAAESGDESTTMWLISKGANLNEVDKNGYTPLHVSCISGQSAVTRLLVRKGAYCNARDNSGETPLFHSCVLGDLAVAQFLVEEGHALWDIVNFRLNSVLHAACNSGHEALSKWLVSKGASLSSKNVSELTAIDRAVRKNNISLAKALCAVQKQQQALDESVYHFFDMCSVGDVPGLEEYLSSGGDPNAVDSNMTSGLHILSANEHLEAAFLLIKAGARVDVVDTCDGYTPFHVACCERRNDFAQWLVQFGGANPMQRTLDHRTSLHLACESGHLTLVEWCVCIGMDANAVDCHGNCPVHKACRGGFEEICRLLVERGARLDGANLSGALPFHEACQSGSLELVKWIYDRDRNVVACRDNRGYTGFLTASGSGQVEIVKWMISQGIANTVSTTGKCENSCNALMLSCLNGHFEMCKLLCEDLKMSLTAENDVHQNSLSLAIMSGEEELIDWIKDQLKEKGVPREVAVHKQQTNKHATTDGANLIHGAAAIGDINLLALLIQKGVDVNSLTNSGFSALHVACAAGKLEAVKFLMIEGADSSIVDSTGRTPSDYASMNGYDDIVEHLNPNGNSTAQSEVMTPAVVSASFFQDCLPIFSFASPPSPSPPPLQKDVQPKHRSPIPSDGTGEVVSNDLCALCIASSAGDVNRVRGAIVSAKRASKLNASCGSEGFTPLHFACAAGNLKTVALLLSEGANVHATNKGGCTPLYIACAKNLSDVAIALIKSGSDVCCKNKEGNTPLHLMCANGMSASFQYVLEQPRSSMRTLDLEAKNEDNNTLLHCAVDGGCFEIVKVLCACASLVNSRDKSNRTPLHMACLRSHNDIAMCLLEHQAFVNARDDSGMTPLHYTCQTENLQLLKLLVKNGANIRVECDQFGNALHIACSAGNLSVCKVLVEMGLDLFEPGEYTEAPASLASKTSSSLRSWIAELKSKSSRYRKNN